MVWWGFWWVDHVSTTIMVLNCSCSFARRLWRTSCDFSLGLTSATRRRPSSKFHFHSIPFTPRSIRNRLRSLFIRLDDNGEPKKKGASSQTAIKVVELQQALPRARIVYCSATAVSHPMNLGFMSRLGLWGYGTEHPMGKSRVPI